MLPLFIHWIFTEYLLCAKDWTWYWVYGGIKYGMFLHWRHQESSEVIYILYTEDWLIIPKDFEWTHVETSVGIKVIFFKCFKNHFKQFLYKWHRRQSNCYTSVSTGHSYFSFWVSCSFLCFPFTVLFLILRGSWKYLAIVMLAVGF